MKVLSIVGLLFVAAIVATVPISPQVTTRGIELGVDQAQAQVLPMGAHAELPGGQTGSPTAMQGRAGYTAASIAPATDTGPATQ